MKIGYVGLGAMGGALARWLVPGHELWVRDLNPAAMERLAEAGARIAASLPDLAREVDMVFLCLPRSTDVEAAIFGAGGLAEGLRAGQIVIDQSSGLPDQTRAMAERLEAMGVTLLDAPVAGGVPLAVAGTITVMLSGPDAAQTRAMPVLGAMTARLFRAGDTAGDAQRVKCLNNMVNMVQRFATLELAALAVRLGAALGPLTEALEAGPAGNFTCRSVLPAILGGRSTGDFALTLMLKDNEQALAFAMEADVPMPLATLSRGLLQQTIGLFGPAANLDDVIAFTAQTSGTRYLDTYPAAEDVTALTVTALAACNRIACLEILSLGTRLGLDPADLGAILGHGSAWSRQCEAVLAEQGGVATGRTLGDTVTALRTLERANPPGGGAIPMLGQVRAILEAAQAQLGAGSDLRDLAGLYALSPAARPT